jgi:ACS family glucarate transporter-like MFS transporter
VRNRTVAGLILCKFFQDYLFYLFVTWLPGYLVLSRGFSILKMGWYASLPWIAGCIAQPLAGWVSDELIRRGVSITVSRKSIIVLMQLLAALVIAAGYARDAMTAVWILIFSVACESAATSILWTACADVGSANGAGLLAGVMNSAGALAGILAPIATGFLAKSSGSFQLPLLVGGCMVLCAAAAMLFIAGELKPID